MEYKIPVIAFAGSVTNLAEQSELAGIEHIFPILTRPCSLAEAMDDAELLLFLAVKRVIKLVLSRAEK